MHESTIRAAWITASAVVAAALIGALATFLSRPSPIGASGVSTRKNERALQPSPTGEKSVPAVPAIESQTSASRPHYEVTAWVGEDKTFVDPETGFVYAVEEITDGLFGETQGSFSRYTFPNGERFGTYRYGLGYRVNFEYRGRRFFFVIEDIDYKAKRAKVRIREF